jgi:hypothetical protein
MRTISSLIILSFFFGIYAAAPVSAQSDTTKKALENVKESVTTLINAKDEENKNEITFRIEAFKKVIDFSIAEAKDFKVKLLTLDAKKIGAPTNVWREEMIKKIEQALEYYNKEKDFIKKYEGEITLEEIKTRAESFKLWRETIYLPAADEINDYFLIEQQKQALETTKKRGDKIRGDIEKLKKTKIKTLDLQKLLSKTDLLMKEAEELYEKAASLFYKTKIEPLTPKENDLEIKKPIEENTTSTATSTISNNKEGLSELSIRDLAKESFARVKDIYRIFIDMSNIVRKLL